MMFPRTQYAHFDICKIVIASFVVMEAINKRNVINVSSSL
jgi:hypothetical protein